MAAPVSDAERKAEEARQKSEMMRPPSNAPARTGAAPESTPPSAADKKAAEAQSKSEMMKPQ